MSDEEPVDSGEPAALSTDESDALERIAKDDPDGLIQPAAVVEAARDPESPLHRYIWHESDEKAAHERRLALARGLITRYRVVAVVKETAHIKATVRSAPPPSVPKFVNVTMPSGRRGYVPMDRVVADPDLYQQVINDARTGVIAWRNRLDGFEHAQPIVAALDEAIHLIEGQEAA